MVRTGCSDRFSYPLAKRRSSLKCILSDVRDNTNITNEPYFGNANKVFHCCRKFNALVEGLLKKVFSLLWYIWKFVSA